METYLAGRFRPLITNGVKWNGAMARAILTPEQRAAAERMVAAHPETSPEEFAQASTAVESQYPTIRAAARVPAASTEMVPWLLALILYGHVVVWVVIPSLVGAVVFGRGLAMHTLGIAVVRPDGKPSRWRSLQRALGAWLPFLLSPIGVNAAKKVVGVNSALVAAAIVLGLATLFSLALRRSLQDRLAGTYLVPKGESRETERASNGKKRRLRLATGITLL
jgi:hypothetical protein